jgi:hypothetical protein
MDFIIVSELQGLGQCWAFLPVVHVRRRVKSPTLSRYTSVMGFISLEQTSFLKVPFVEE